MGCGKIQFHWLHEGLASSHRGVAVQNNKNIPMRMRERGVERGQKELARLQHNKS